MPCPAVSLVTHLPHFQSHYGWQFCYCRLLFPFHCIASQLSNFFLSSTTSPLTYICSSIVFSLIESSRQNNAQVGNSATRVASECCFWPHLEWHAIAPTASGRLPPSRWAGQPHRVRPPIPPVPTHHSGQPTVRSTFPTPFFVLSIFFKTSGVLFFCCIPSPSKSLFSLIPFSSKKILVGW